MKRLLFWTPRALCILFAVFISLFALDVFSAGYGVRDTIVALIMHLIPSYIVLALLIIAWRWERVGGILFTALGVWYILAFWDQAHWSAYLLISGPLLVVGVLFLISWWYEQALRARA